MSKKPDLSGKTILVVEDNVFIAMELESEFEDAGATVFSHGDAAAALAFLQTRTIDFLLTDYFLMSDLSRPVIEGANARSVPYALLTGYNIDPADPLLSEAKIFTKPCSAAQIVSYVAAVLDAAMDGADDLAQN